MRIRYVGGKAGGTEVRVHTRGEGWKVYGWNAGNGFVEEVGDEEVAQELLEDPTQFVRAGGRQGMGEPFVEIVGGGGERRTLVGVKGLEIRDP